MEEKNNKINKEIKELVIVRLESMPDTIKIAFGSGKELTKEQLIEHVKEEDSFGKLIVDMQVKYLESLKNL